MGVRLTVLPAGSQTAESEISYQFDQQRVVIGRGAGADVRLPHLTVSETHAVLQLQGDEYCIVDSGSTNGTRVNGKRLVPSRPKPLQDGDRIQVGRYLLSVHTAAAVAASSTTERTAELARRLVRQVLDPAQPEIGPPELRIVNGPQAGQRLAIADAPSRALVGRGPSCQLVLSDAGVSREHMEVIRDMDGVLVRNLDSKNGIIVGQNAVTERRLKNGNEIALGETRLRFEDPAEASILQMSGLPDQRALPETANAMGPDDGAGPGPEAGRTEQDQESIAVQSPKRAARPVFPAGAELVIYLLAIAILVLSVAGLVLLLRAG
jgi:pSer/pThr/pTyr-binding forkhead associated (FHA) protein